MKKKFVWVAASLAMLLIFGAAMLMVRHSADNEAPVMHISQGVLDLTDWEPDKDGIRKLDGEWEFYWNKLLTPKEIDASNPLSDKPDGYYLVPSSWKGTVGNKKLGYNGAATYHLKIKISNMEGAMGIKLISARMASRIFIDGIERGGNGEPINDSTHRYRAKNVPVVAMFPVSGNSIDIVIQIANHDYGSGGIIQGVVIGSEHDIIFIQSRAIILNTIAIACLLISSIYYVGIYLSRRKDMEYLLLCLYCIILAYITSVSEEKLLFQYFENADFILLLQLKSAAGAVCTYLIYIFIRTVNRSFVKKWLDVAVNTIVGLNLLTLLVLPYATFAHLEATFLLMNILIYVAFAIVVLVNLSKRNYGSLNFKSNLMLLVVLVLIVMEFTNTVLYINSIIHNSLSTTVPLLLFLFAIAVFISMQYSIAYDSIEAMSRRLIEIDHNKDEFLINTSHELKTPVHAIINISKSILENEAKPDSNNMGNLKYIISVATKMSSLINDMVDFEGIRDNNLVFFEHVLDVNAATQITLDILQYMRKGDNIQLINEISPGSFYVRTDENRLRQVLMNLGGNAIKHTDKGTIRISAKAENGMISISVSDTGNGMDTVRKQEIKNRLEDKDFTEKPSLASDGRGLLISKLLVEKMGGRLWLVSSEPGKGTTFTFTVPLVEKEEVEIQDNLPLDSIQNLGDESQDEAVMSMQSIEGTKILLVDDESSNIKVLQNIFKYDGFELLVAYSGKQALKILEQERSISLVLLDVMMPGQSGFDVCRRIREHYSQIELPVILLTVRYSPNDIALGFEAGANDFIAKPFDPKELKARIRTQLEMKRSVEEKVQMENSLLQAQIKPHFIYNALSVIMSLCYTDPLRAGTLLAAFSNFLRGSIDVDIRHADVSLEKELSITASYIEIEKARFADRLNYLQTVPEELMDLRLPALSIQPLVENAVKHGLMKRLSGGTVEVTVEIQQTEQLVVVSIHDDGVGIPEEMLKTLLNVKNTGSVGLINVHTRLMNEYRHGLVVFSEEGVGTTVSFSIPYKTSKLFRKEVTNDDESYNCG